MVRSIQRGRVIRPPRILVYGTPGIGKTTFAASASQVVFLPTEEGLDMLDVDRFPLATTYEQVTSALDELLREEHDYWALAIDSLDWLERIIFERVCSDHNASCIEKVDGGFGRGYVYALTYWRDIVRRLDALRNQRSMLVILVAHAKTERVEEPDTPGYERHTPRLHKSAAGMLTEWCDAVLYAHRKVRTTKEDVGFGRSRNIVRTESDRIVRCIGTATCVAKNRYGLPEEMFLNWHTVINAIVAKQKEKENN